jgi:hypothetical protein
MNFDGGNASGDALIFFIVSLVIAWLIIYTAVRAAVGHALDRENPRLVAEATTTPDGVHFAVLNAGTAPAIDLTVRWFGAPADATLARTPLLGIDARLEWSVPAPMVVDETTSVRKLTLEWARDTDPSLGRHSMSCPVLVPSRLDAAG